MGYEELIKITVDVNLEKDKFIMRSEGVKVVGNNYFGRLRLIC